MIFYVLLNLRARESLGIKASSWRHGIGSNKRSILLQEVKTRSIDPQIASQFQVARILASRERLIQRERFRITLTPENVFKIMTSLDQLLDQLALENAQTGRIEPHAHFAKFVDARVQIRSDLHPSGFRSPRCGAGHEPRFFLR